jgi:hypothetical protein
MITLQEISSASYDKLQEIKNDLIVQKMKLDRFFSVFLDSVELSDENVGDDNWITYREMLKDYNEVEHLIRTTDYYIGQYERSTSI